MASGAAAAETAGVFITAYQSAWAWASAVILLCAALLAVTLAIVRNRGLGTRRQWLKPIQALFAGAFAACVVFLAPAFAVGENAYNAAAMAVAAAMRIFIMDGSVTDLRELLRDSYGIRLAGWQLLYCSFLYILSPLLTLSAILAMLSGVFSQLLYLLHPLSDLYVFSELNDACLTLARDIRSGRAKGRRRAFFIFCGARSGDTHPELIRAARGIGAIVIQRDILRVGLRFHAGGSARSFLFCSAVGQQAANMEKATQWLQSRMDKPGIRKASVCLYVFSTQNMADLYIESLAGRGGLSGLCRADEVKAGRLRGLLRPGRPAAGLPEAAADVSVIRVNVHREVVYNLLDSHPLFTGLSPGEALNVLVVGGGQIGEEFVKAVLWCGQMDRHRELTIHIVDEKSDILDHLWAQCPDIMRHNESAPGRGDGEYSVRFSRMNVRSGAFFDFLAENPDFSYVLVALGDDDANIRAAADIRSACSAARVRLGKHPAGGAGRPAIHLVVEDDGKSAGAGRFSVNGQPFDLVPIGSVGCTYRESVILRPLDERLAFFTHLAYMGLLEEYQDRANAREGARASSGGLPKDGRLMDAVAAFRDCEYNRRGSYAFALHIKYKLYDTGCMDTIEGGADTMAFWHAFSSGAAYCAGAGRRASGEASASAPLREKALAGFEKLMAAYYESDDPERNPAYTVKRLPCAAVLEHRRWNAFMRTQGYSRATLDDVRAYCPAGRGSAVRFDLARLHPAIVPWENASDEAAFQKLERDLSALIPGSSAKLRNADHMIVRRIPDIVRAAYQGTRSGDKPWRTQP